MSKNPPSSLLSNSDTKIQKERKKLETKFEKNLQSIRELKNLPKRQHLLLENLQIIKKDLQITTSMTKPELDQELDTLNSEIETESSNLQTLLEEGDQYLQQSEFSQAAQRINTVQMRVKDNGLVSFENPAKNLQKNIKLNLKISKMMEEISKTEISQLILDEINNNIWLIDEVYKEIQEYPPDSVFIHPELLSRLEEQKSNLMETLTERGASYVPPNIKTKMSHHLGDLKDKVGDKVNVTKFRLQLEGGKNKENLQKAQDSLFKAQEILQESPHLFSQDQQTDLLNSLEKINSEIARVTEETEYQISKTQEMMENRLINPAINQLETFFQKIQPTGLDELLRRIKIGLEDLKINGDLLNDLNAAVKLFDEGQFHSCLISIQQINEKYQLESISARIFPRIKDDMNSEITRISSSISQAEIQLINEIGQLEQDIKKQLDFPAIQAEFKSKRDLAEKAGFDTVIQQLTQIQQIFDLNMQLFEQMNNINENLLTLSYSQLSQELDHMDQMINEPENNYYPKIVEKYTADIRIQIINQLQQIQADLQSKIDNITPIIEEELNFNEAQSMLSELKNQAQNQGLKLIESQISDLLQEIEINKSIQEELNSLEILFQTDHLNRCSNQLELINSRLTENPNIFFTNIKDAVDEISTRVENTILKASQVLDSEVDSLMQEAKETLEINDTLEKLKIYKSKADKILAKSSINKIETFETVLAKNLQLLTDFDQYKGKYELGEFLSAEEGIQRLSNICAIDSVTIFEQISQKIEKLNETLKREKEEEQETN